MDKDALSYKTLKNSSYLLLGFLAPMVFTIFVTRALATELSTLEFGVFLLLNAINSFAGYIDLGLGTAVTKFAAEYHARGDIESLQNLLSSARAIFFLTGIIGLAGFFILGKWFLPVFNIPAQSYYNIFIVFVLSGLIFFLNGINAVYNAILGSLQRFDLITKIGTLNLIAVSLGTIALLRLGFQLKAIMTLNVVSVFFQILTVRYYSGRLLPGLQIRFMPVRKEVVKAYRFGLQTFISSLADSCLVFLDRLIIPIFLGPAQLAFYSVPGNVALKISGVTNNLTGMIFPMASALSGTGQMEKLKNIYIRAFRNLSVVAFALAVAVIFFAEKILFFWLGSDYARQGTLVLRILSVTYYFIALYIPLRGMLLGLGKVALLIRQSIIMAIINVVLLLILVPRFGIAGAAWAYLFSVLPMIFTFYWVERNLFSLTRQVQYYLKLYAKLFFTALADSLIIYFGLLPLAKNVWVLVIVGPVSVLVYPALYLIFGFVESEDRALFKSYLLSVKDRFWGVGQPL